MYYTTNLLVKNYFEVEGRNILFTFIQLCIYNIPTYIKNTYTLNRLLIFTIMYVVYDLKSKYNIG